MYLFIIYILGFILCIIGNLFDSHNKDDELGVAFFVCIFVISPITVPIIIGIGILILIGFVISRLSKLLNRLITE